MNYITLPFINGYKVVVTILGQLVDLVLHGVEVMGEPVLGPVRVWPAP